MDEVKYIGFLKTGEKAEDAVVLRVDGSTFFPLLLSEGRNAEVSILVEDLDEFFRVLVERGISPSSKIEGDKYSPYRRLILKEEKSFKLAAIERRGYSGFSLQDYGDNECYLNALRTLEARERKFVSDEEGLRATRRLLEKLMINLPRSRLSDAFFRAERAYWESKSNAAVVQGLRQRGLGLGWGNCDHYTFRSSRTNYTLLMGIFELLGMSPRERFYAGDQAGWGAQILEQNDCNVCVFADVDLSPDERSFDFVCRRLPERKTIGTVGLWVGLNGESILQAGLHHLAARFKFDGLTADLRLKGIDMMKPFSNFPFLKQAFSGAEFWKVDKRRVKTLEDNSQISHESLTKFLEKGVIGSHLENIERNQGFKGFNQDSVSVIIKLTDPRTQGYKVA